MTPNKIRFFYILYIVAVTAFFLYWLFPDSAVRSYLSFRLKSANPDFNLTLVQAKPTFPPGLKLEKMNISHKNMPVLDIAELKIGPDLRSLFSPGNTFLFKADLYGGTIKGRLDLNPKAPNHAVVLNSAITGIQIGSSAGLERLLKRKISGTLGGTVQFESREGGAGVVSAGLNLSDAKVEILASVFGMEHLSFKNISADITAAGKNVRIKTGIIRGDQIDGKFNGTVELTEPISKSILDLSGSFRPHHQFLADLRKRLPVNFLSKKRTDNNEFPVQFAGTIDSPVFSLN
ncbi:MAG: type II secretion system protein GspN [Desulfobacterales bacterium]|nr:type II secretion system protein GspN [Desulfobacterales bacterium]